MHPDWDPESLNATRDLLSQLAARLHDFAGAFGSRRTTDPIKHLPGTAAGWGGLPGRAGHLHRSESDLPVGHYVLEVPADVPVRGFWSISVYNADGYFEPNDTGRYSINNLTAVQDSDGGATIHLGGDPSLPNSIPLPEGWNYTVRPYKPEAAILDGTWTFPAPSPAPVTQM